MRAAARHCRALLTGSVLLFLESARGADFGVAPLRVEIPFGVSSATVVLTNNGSEEVLVQSQVLAWSQSQTGDELRDTDEVLVSPPIFKIPPRARQTIRLGLLRKANPSRELTYRLFLQEVPRPKPAGEQGGVAVLLRLSLPVFVKPSAKAAPSLGVHAHTSKGGELKLTIQNRGNAHSRAPEVKISAPDGGLLAVQQLDGYLLAGHARTWSIKLGRPLQESRIRITAKAEGAAIDREIQVASD
jgi:fimbrial chaperone protein